MAYKKDVSGLPAGGEEWSDVGFTEEEYAAKSALLESRLNTGSKADKAKKLRKRGLVSAETALIVSKFEKRKKKVAVGAFFDFMLNELALKRNNAEFFNALSFDYFDQANVPPPSYAFCDWLKCTQPNFVLYQEFCSKAFTYFVKAGFDIEDTGKGMNGYSHSFALKMKGERVGTFAADEKMGGLFELTGAGCQLMQVQWSEWCKMMWSLKLQEFRITRMDVSVDLDGAVCRDMGISVPSLLSEHATDQLFRVGCIGSLPAVTQNGDWSCFMTGECSTSTYDPAIHAPSGLTLNIGARGGRNQFCIYEKGKQELGKKLVKSLSVEEASKVRIERRLGRGKGDGRVVIDFRSTIFLDDALTFMCPKFEKFMDRYLAGGGGTPASCSGDVSFERVGNYIKKKVLKKVFHLMQQGKKCINTLIDLGFNNNEIVNMLRGTDGVGIAGFIDDITDKDDIELEFNRIKRMMA